MQLTEVHVDAAGRTHYAPILTKIVRESEYNKGQQFALDGIDGFWDRGRIEIPPALLSGGVAWFTLASKPKTGPNAKPGSRYLDIMDISPATAEQKAAYTPPTRAAAQSAGRYNGPTPGSAASPGQQDGTTVEQRITLGMAFNNLTTVLTMKDSAKYLADGVDGWELWNKWFSEASRGLPLSPVVDENEAAIVEEAEQLDQQAEDAISEPEIVDGQEVESLPW
jgi:hypothetical protein